MKKIKVAEDVNITIIHSLDRTKYTMSNPFQNIGYVFKNGETSISKTKLTLNFLFYFPEFFFGYPLICLSLETEIDCTIYNQSKDESRKDANYAALTVRI